MHSVHVKKAKKNKNKKQNYMHGSKITYTREYSSTVYRSNIMFSLYYNFTSITFLPMHFMTLFTILSPTISSIQILLND